MMKLLRVLALSVAPLGLAAVTLPAPAIAQQAGLAEAQAHLRAVSSMTANFTQRDRKGKTSSGTFALKRPGKIRFQYQNEPILIVADGRRLTFIDDAVNQRQSWPIGNSPLSVLLDPNRDLSRFARVIENNASTLLIEARDPQRREFGTIQLAFTKVGGAPAGLRLDGWNALDAQNNFTTVRLSGQRFNVSVADSLFRVPPARGRGPRR